MSQTDSKPSDKEKSTSSSLFDISNVNAAMWAPYSSLASLFSGVQRDARAFVQINRKLADEFREMARRQQDLALDLTVKMLNQTLETARSAKPSGMPQNEPRRRSGAK